MLNISGRIIIAEWAKFRWGVFEEYGILGDSIYPPAYMEDNSLYFDTQITQESEYRFLPNLCSNQPVITDL